MTRLQKVELISGFEQTYDWFNVCWITVDNCGSCEKCRRTLLELDFLGTLEKYKNSFDIDKYKAKRDIYISYMYSARKSDVFMKELYEYALANNIRISPKNKVMAYAYLVMGKIFPKALFKKIKTIVLYFTR